MPPKHDRIVVIVVERYPGDRPPRRLGLSPRGQQRRLAATRRSRDHRQPAPRPLPEPIHELRARDCVIPRLRRVQLRQQQARRPCRGSIRARFARNSHCRPRLKRRQANRTRQPGKSPAADATGRGGEPACTATRAHAAKPSRRRAARYRPPAPRGGGRGSRPYSDPNPNPRETNEQLVRLGRASDEDPRPSVRQLARTRGIQGRRECSQGVQGCKHASEASLGRPCAGLPVSERSGHDLDSDAAVVRDRNRTNRVTTDPSLRAAGIAPVGESRARRALRRISGLLMHVATATVLGCRPHGGSVR